MYNSVLIYLIAFTIVTMAQPTGQESADPAGLWQVLAIVAASWALIRLRLRAIARGAMRSGAAAEHWRPRFAGLVLKLQAALLVPFALILYTTPYAEIALGGWLEKSDLLSSLAGLLPYFALVVILWSEAYPLKSVLLGNSSSRGSFIISNSRMEFSILGPWMIVAAISDAVRYAFPSLYETIESNSLAALVYSPVFLLIAAIFLPLAVNALWGSRPMPEGPTREMLLSLAKRMNLKVRDIMLWPVMEGKVMTAGIIGLVPRYRYLLITPALLDALTGEEIAGVVAHEAGHVRHRHLWFYLLFFAGLFASVVSLIYEMVDLAAIWGQMAHPGLVSPENIQNYLAVAAGALTVVLIIVGFRFVFGAMSRSFERQADLYSLQVMGSPAPLAAALGRISARSGDIKDLPSWHHGSIAERIAFLERAAHEPGAVMAHEEKIRKIKRSLWIGLVVFSSLAAAARIPAVRDPLRFAAQKSGIESYISRHPDEAGPVMALGMLYFENGREAEGARELYKAVEINPKNPYAQNALAWVLVRAEDQGVKNCEEAVSRAEAACLSLPLPSFLDTLAEAHFCLGEVEEARKTIEIALDFAKNSGAEEEIPYLERQRERFFGKNASESP